MCASSSRSSAEPCVMGEEPDGARPSRRRVSTLMDDRSLSVSVVVPTFNRRSRLARLLAGLDHLPEAAPTLEVLVSVDGSTDGTVEFVRQQRPRYRLCVIELPNRGPAAARNAAIAAATGDVLLFLDDDVVPTIPLIAEHLDRHRREERVAVIGPMVAPPSVRLPAWLRWEALTLEKQYRDMERGRWKPTPRQFFTANASVRRQLALAVGGFDERFTRGEDVEFAYRLAAQGVAFRFAPGAVVHHEPDRTFASWLRVPYEYGKHSPLFRNGGAPYYLLMMHEDRRRNVLSRVLARMTVGHRRLQHAVTALFGWFVQDPALDHLARAKLAVCSALFNLLFWQGVADGTGLGARVWEAREAAARDGAARLTVTRSGTAKLPQPDLNCESDADGRPGPDRRGWMQDELVGRVRRPDP